MAYILNIDTATESASVCLSRDKEILSIKENKEQKEHASFIHVAIGELVKESGIELSAVDAIAVTSGPGSYTGLRVGMATAKGFCYALQKPLITISTLIVMTNAAKRNGTYAAKDNLFCPMIDARRMEVFTGLYNDKFESLVQPQPVILDEHFMSAFLPHHPILFFGSGSSKFQQICSHENGSFIDVDFGVSDLADLATDAYYNNNFADVSYVEPTYLKGFYNVAK